jgi:glycosyltransferase A (GT-A) superfamily protein (DUF2064 family)
LIADCALIVMAKQPQPGRTKTRLCPPLTPQQAALFYEALLLDTFALAAGLPGVQLAAAITPPDSEHYFKRIAPQGTLLIPIEGADIGECLYCALAELLQRGFRRAIALNADGPSLPLAYLQQAVTLLNDHDVVLGTRRGWGILFNRLEAGGGAALCWHSLEHRSGAGANPGTGASAVPARRPDPALV